MTEFDIEYYLEEYYFTWNIYLEYYFTWLLRKYFLTRLSFKGSIGGSKTQKVSRGLVPWHKKYM